MPIETKCPGCGVVLKAPDDAKGKRIKCPKCGAEMVLPLDAPPPTDAARAAPPATPPPVAPPGAPLVPPPVDTASLKSQSVAFVLSMLLGSLGIDRFYLGYVGWGIVKLLTCGGLGIWGLIDFLLIGMGSMHDARGLPLREELPAGMPTKSRSVAFILSWLLGGLGIDRFYLGYVGLGIIKLLTCGGLGIWSLIDVILIGIGSMKDAAGNSLRKS
jgi:TM2 domain-containing membrane protein YozV